MMQIPHRDHRSKSVWVVSGSIVAMVSAFKRHRYEELSVGAGLYPGRASSPVGDPRRRIAGSVRAVMCSPADAVIRPRAPPYEPPRQSSGMRA